MTNGNGFVLENCKKIQIFASTDAFATRLGHANTLCISKLLAWRKHFERLRSEKYVSQNIIFGAISRFWHPPPSSRQLLHRIPLTPHSLVHQQAPPPPRGSCSTSSPSRTCASPSAGCGSATQSPHPVTCPTPGAHHPRPAAAARAHVLGGARGCGGGGVAAAAPRAAPPLRRRPSRRSARWVKGHYVLYDDVDYCS